MTRPSEFEAHAEMLARSRGRAIARAEDYRSLLMLRKALAHARAERAHVEPDAGLEPGPRSHHEAVVRAVAGLVVVLALGLPLAMLAFA